jgi:hypothetical protein
MSQKTINIVMGAMVVVLLGAVIYLVLDKKSVEQEASINQNNQGQNTVGETPAPSPVPTPEPTPTPAPTPTPMPISQTPKNVSFKTQSNKCAVLLDGKVIGTINTNPCGEEPGITPSIVVKNDLGAYIITEPIGVGGAISYGETTGLFYVDYAKSSLTKIFDQNFVTDVAFNSDETKLAYSTNQSLVVKNIPSGTSKTYARPGDASVDMYQFGSFLFSPDSKKVAVGVSYGIDVKGEVYVLDLATGKYTLQATTNTAPNITGWSGNTVNYK